MKATCTVYPEEEIAMNISAESTLMHIVLFMKAKLENILISVITNGINII